MTEARSVVSRDSIGALLGGVGGMLLAGSNVLFQMGLDGPAGPLRFAIALALLGGTVGIYVSAVRASLALSREPVVDPAEPSETASNITRADLLIQGLGWHLALIIALGTAALAMHRLVEAAFEPGPFHMGSGEMLAVAGFVLCTLGALAQTKVRQLMKAKYVPA
jgi:hypothetical protein